jgi:preprotein translocase subunit SecG
MSPFEIVCGALLLFSCLLIIFVVLIQESKDQGMSSAITGGSSDSFYGKNGKNTKDAKIGRFTKIAGFIFFAATLAVNIAAVYVK